MEAIRYSICTNNYYIKEFTNNIDAKIGKQILETKEISMSRHKLRVNLHVNGEFLSDKHIDITVYRVVLQLKTLVSHEKHTHSNL